MKARTIVLALLILLFAVFVAVNWSAFLVPTTLSLLVATVEAPLGLVLLGVLVVAALLFVGSMAWWQAHILRDTRRHTQEMQAQRALADQAEASRFTALQGVLTAELARLEAKVGTTGADVARRVEAGTAELRRALQDSGNSLAATLGEVEDRVERALDPARAPRLS